MASYDPDHELVLRVAQRDTYAYGALVGKHLNRCLKVAERMLGNRQDAEDVVQEVCLKIWKEAARWKPKAKFSTWLYRVLLNACLDHKRRAIRFETDLLDEIADESPMHDEKMMHDQRSYRVKEALQQLPDRQRAAIVLGYYEGMSNQEAAEAMDVTLGSFQQLLFRAKQNLRDTLADFLPENEDEAQNG